MSDYFTQILHHSRKTYLDRLNEAFQATVSMASQGGYLFSGANVTKHRKVVAETVTGFADHLMHILVKFETAYSPVDVSDFILAKRAIDTFVLEAETEYRAALRRFENKLPDGLVDQSFSEGSDAATEANLQLEGLRLEFKSRKSFRRWAIGDIQKRLWSGFLVALGALLMAIFDRVLLPIVFGQ